MRFGIVLLFASALVCSASTSFVLCSSGFSTATTSGCGPAINSPAANSLSPDGNWYVASNSSGTFFSQAFVTVNNAFPLQNAGPWLANDSGSSWITPSNNQGATYSNNTATFYSTQFSLTGISDLSSVTISGDWLADDYGSGIFLNGVSVGQVSLPAFGGLGGPLVAFTINGSNLGGAAFLPGLNTLTFGVVNDATNHGSVNDPSPGPTGIRVLFTEADGTGVTGTPEPGTFAMFAAGLAICLQTRLRRRSS